MLMMPDLKACKETNSTNHHPNIKRPDIDKFTTKLTNIDSPLNTSSDARRRSRRRSPPPPPNLSYKPASDMAQKIKKKLASSTLPTPSLLAAHGERLHFCTISGRRRRDEGPPMAVCEDFY